MTEATNFNDCIGIYREGVDHLIGISRYLADEPGAGPLAYHDFATGWIRMLNPVGTDTFAAGPGLLIPSPTVATVEFERDGNGKVVSLMRSDGDAGTLTATRLPLRREDVHFENDEISLAGTLTLPTGPGPHPAVVLIHGSGSASRYSFGPYPEYFAAHGIAALAYDKRGVGESTGQHFFASLGDFAGDALAAHEHVRAREDIAQNHVGLWGRSQGGWIAPMAAARSADVAFVVINVGPAMTPEEQEFARTELELRADGFSEADITRALRHAELLYDLTRGSVTADQLEVSSRDAALLEWGPYVAILPSVPPGAAEFMSRFSYNHDAEATLAALRCPVLALLGERDRVVPAQENAERITEALKRGGNADFEVVILPRANHAGLVATTGGRKERPFITEFVVEAYSLTVDWIRAHVGASR